MNRPFFAGVRKGTHGRPITVFDMKPRFSILSLGERSTTRQVACILCGLLLSGCAVPVHQQRLVSQPNMQFSDSPVFSYQARQLTQIESGAAAYGGAQAAGCTSCR